MAIQKNGSVINNRTFFFLLFRKHFDSFDNVPNEKVDRHKECNSIRRKQERPGVPDVIHTK